MKYIFWMCLIVVAVCLFGLVTKKDAAPVLPDPPVEMSFRPSKLWPGYVAQITNTHSAAITIALNVVNDEEHQEKTWDFPIPYGETKEIGMLEVNWHFDPGEHGYVQVQGYTKKLYYKLKSDGEYSLWFGL